MYNVIKAITKINSINIMDNFSEKKIIKKIPVLDSEFISLIDGECKVLIDHKTNTNKYPKGGFDGYENGIWKLENYEIIIFQDYGDHEHELDSELGIELNSSSILGNSDERSLAIFNNLFCIIIPNYNVLDVYPICEVLKYNIEDLNYKRPYNIKFFVDNKNDISVYISFCGEVLYKSLNISFNEFITPYRLNDIINRVTEEVTIEVNETVTEEQIDIKKTNDGYITLYYLIHRGFSYNADESYFYKDNLFIYGNNGYYSVGELSHKDDKLIWYQSEVENLLTNM